MLFQRHNTTRQGLADQDLISHYRSSGDSAFVGELFERYSIPIYAICRKYFKDEDDAKDAAMEVFEYLLAELKKYDIQTFKSWLARAVSNFCLMRIRKRKSIDGKAEEFKKNEIAVMESVQDLHPEVEATEKELELQKLEAALGGLNEEQKTCVELFFLKGKSYEEVAQLTGYNFNQVKSFIQNGKRNLKIRLTEGNA